MPIKRIALAAAFAAFAPNLASAQICATIYAYTLTDREVQIAEDIVGRVVRRPIPEGGTIHVCDNQENAFRQSLREAAERRADLAWARFIELGGGEEAIRRQIVDNAGPCPTILNRLANERPRGTAPVLVSCTNGRSYQLLNWADERNAEEPVLRYLTVREVE